ncbi:MAG: hypothetical protein HY049_18140 [Acidobacteria bacterium]|nr:hypothetical protein [Acidobacteriota bacterium]
MAPLDQNFLREFFGNLTDRPLEPDDKQYVHLYEVPELKGNDPVELLARGIEWTSGESVQLLSGFRGTGKSTELRRLQKRLQAAGHVVLLCDIEDYLNLSTNVDVSDFLVALAGAFGDAVAAQSLLKKHPAQESYWTRLVNFFTRTNISLKELELEAKTEGPVSIGGTLKANLKSDPSFRQLLQKKMAGFLGALVADVRAYVEESVKTLRKEHGADAKIVLLVDSVEHIRGTSVNASAVQSSVETLFAGHADKLQFPYLHVVYTVPPYLKVRYPNLGSLFAPGGVQVLPALKIRHEHDGKPFKPGLEAMRRVVGQRGDWKKLLGEEAVLDGLILQSGGHLRDLLRIVAEIVRRAGALPVPKPTVDAAVNQIRTEFLPIADADAVWLERIARTHKASLEDAARLPDLARFLDTHLVLCYRNASEWYDVHPLILEEIRAQAQLASSRPSPS